MSVLKIGREGGGRQVCRLPLDKIVPNARQPRRAFNDIALLELAASIRCFGLLQPVTVRKVGEKYELIMGERRCRACRLLGYTQIDAFILPASGPESAMLALVENLQRENLHYMEEAEAYAALVSSEMSQDALARRLGKSASAVANKIRLLKLSPELRSLLAKSDLTERHARALLTVTDAEKQMEIAKEAIEKHLTVRQTEMLALSAGKREYQGRHVVSYARDHRLYLNAIKDIVGQMRRTGVNAEIKTTESARAVEVRITFPKDAGTNAGVSIANTP